MACRSKIRSDCVGKKTIEITPDVPISIQVQNVNTTSGYSSGDLSDSDDAIPVSDSDQQKRGQKRKSELKRKPEVKYNC